jgi:hypothetical protein
MKGALQPPRLNCFMAEDNSSEEDLMNQTVLQRSLNIPLDDPRVRRITEIHDKGLEASEAEREEVLGLILLLKKQLPPEK